MLMLCVSLPCPKYWIKISPFLTCYYPLLSRLWLDFLELPSAVNQWSLADFSKQNGFLVAKDKFKPTRIKQLFTTKQQPRSRQFQGRTPDPMSHSRFNYFLEAHTCVQGKLKGESNSLSKVTRGIL